MDSESVTYFFRYIRVDFILFKEYNLHIFFELANNKWASVNPVGLFTHRLAAGILIKGKWGTLFYLYWRLELNTTLGLLLPHV